MFGRNFKYHAPYRKLLYFVQYSCCICGTLLHQLYFVCNSRFREFQTKGGVSMFANSKSTRYEYNCNCNYPPQIIISYIGMHFGLLWHLILVTILEAIHNIVSVGKQNYEIMIDDLCIFFVKSLSCIVLHEEGGWSNAKEYEEILCIQRLFRLFDTNIDPYRVHSEVYCVLTILF